jgi:hypothetical protein
MRVLIVLLIAAAWLGPALRAVGADEPKGGHAAEPAALPLTEVVLYSSGVGYFRRDGQVEGSEKIDLRFKVDDVNDLLKSLVVQDLDGGHVAAVSYGSREPITRALKTFGIDLTENPTLGDLLNQVRGERIEVATPNAITGTLVGVEKKKRPVGREDGQVVEVEFLNLLTDEGLRTIPLEQVQRFRLLDDRLAAELRQALEVLAAGHDTRKKAVELRFDGQWRRRIRVAYVVQTPVWKTSYRLVLDDEKAPYLQGWAIVENTTDDDWNEVRLALVSGRPISFVMDLYQPLYAPRPEVRPELYLSLRPQVYGQAMEEAKARERAEAAPAAPEMLARRRPMAAAPMAAAPLAPGRGGLDLAQGVTASASGLQAGELFQYAIKAPVTLARQRSALLPILGEEVAGKKVSIYNASVQPRHPLHGFRLKNTSPLHLMQGPITVFDAGAYAGDARIEDLAPGGERLISYALDLGVEVEPQRQAGPQDLVSVALRKGTLIARRRATDETVYRVRNRDRKERNVLVEHPFRPDWDLTEPKEPAERTRDLYRFEVKVAASQGESLRVREERQLAETIALADIGPDALVSYIRARVVSDKVKEALRRVIELRTALEQTRAERARREQRVGEIAQEQGRIRENMARLAPNSELSNRYVKKLDQQETELEGLRREIEGLKDTESGQQRALNDYLLGLELEG